MCAQNGYKSLQRQKTHNFNFDYIKPYYLFTLWIIYWIINISFIIDWQDILHFLYVLYVFILCYFV